MKTIVEQPIFIKGCLGKQTICGDIKYRPLKYLVITDCEDGKLVYNTLTKQLCLLDESEFYFLSNKPTFYTNEMKRLIEDYFLVPIEFDEEKCFHDIKNVHKIMDSDNYIGTCMILTTTDCNARCFYCCEAGQKRINMTNETATDVAKYLAEHSKGHPLTITWFGGEPLFNIEPIDIISSYLREHNIKYKSRMITNAYLFDEQIIHRAKKDWNLDSVQITLDGTENVYNKTKAYIYNDGNSPFLKVINNIKMLSEHNILTVIRLNMDMYNKDDLYHLVDFLGETFNDTKYVKVYCRLLFDNTSPLQLNRTNDERAILFNELLKFEEYIYDKNLLSFQVLRPEYKGTGCIGTNPHGTVILPNGELGLCDVNTDKEKYGNIYDGITNRAVIDDFIKTKPRVKNCDTCPILPNCHRLVKCMYYIRDCEDYEQEWLIITLKRYVVHTYNVWKAKRFL